VGLVDVQDRLVIDVGDGGNQGQEVLFGLGFGDSERVGDENLIHQGIFLPKNRPDFDIVDLLVQTKFNVIVIIFKPL